MLPAKSPDAILRQYAAEIRTLKGQAAEVLVRIGLRLLDAKKVAKGARFAQFLVECDLHPTTARRFMRIAEAFGAEVPQLPVGRLDMIVKKLSTREERQAFLKSVDVNSLPPERFAAELNRFQRDAEAYKARATVAEKRLAAIEGAIVDAPGQVIEANVALRRVQAAVAHAIASLGALSGEERSTGLESGVVRTLMAQADEFFPLLSGATARR